MRESEGGYRALIEDAQDGMALADAETGRLMDCNRALCRMVEREKADLVGQPQSILHSPEEHTPGGLSSTFRQHQTDAAQALEGTLRSQGGKLVPVEIRASRVRMKGCDCLFGVFRDITERKQAEARLKGQLKELRRWHEVALGRETRVIELKREVNELLAKAGQKPRYASVEGGEEVG